MYLTRVHSRAHFTSHSSAPLLLISSIKVTSFQMTQFLLDTCLWPRAFIKRPASILLTAHFRASMSRVHNVHSRF